MRPVNLVFGFSLAFMVLGAVRTNANGLAVNVRSVLRLQSEPLKAQVEFDLGWNNSWRQDRFPGAGDAYFHDAAWVFVKFRPAGSNDWQHATLSTNSADHQAGSSLPAPEILAVGDGMGVLVRRAAAGAGSVTYEKLKLLWEVASDGYTVLADAEVAVFAIEMVYVPEGPLYLGSGGTEVGSFTDGAWTGDATIPFLITSEDALVITNAPGHLWGTSTSGDSDIGGAGVLSAAYPKGYGGFYCMKYNITQGQYAAFLNSLTAAQAALRATMAAASDRYTISGTHPDYVAAAPDRTCNLLSWRHGAAYMDWAGLRPMTELEYEKACRGPDQPFPNEYAWGSGASILQTGHTGEDGSGTETASPADANVNRTGNFGPIRAGIYAREGTTRTEAGASYWGIMELSGNLAERVVTVGNATGRAFTGLHGNGALGAGALADVAAWPDTTGYGERGGDTQTTDTPQRQRVSNRSYARRSEAGHHAPHWGWRGVRGVE